MNGSLTTLSLPVIGDWVLSNVFSFQFLVLTCLVLCLRQPALHQYISLYSIIYLTYSLSQYKIKENVKLVYWFICTIKQDILQIFYHVEMIGRKGKNGLVRAYFKSRKATREQKRLCPVD